MSQSGIATGFENLGMDLHAPFEKLADLISWSVFALGMSNLFWMPLALCIGKRPAVILSMLVALGGCIWTSVAKDYNSLMGARVLTSFGAVPLSLSSMSLRLLTVDCIGLGSIESIGPSILAGMINASLTIIL